MPPATGLARRLPPPGLVLSLGLVLLLAGCAAESPHPHADPMPDASYPTTGSVERLDARLDALIPPDAVIEVLAEGFAWSEGPVWVPDGGYLLFTDIPNNTVHRWSEADGLGVYLRPAGYGVGEAPPGRELGANGLTLDAQGRLVLCDHGLRQISRLNSSNFTKVALATGYQGRRFNSPNDLVYHRSGALYFTDPPYGLEGLNDSPLKELPYNGVYRLAPDGTVTLLTDALSFPNGLAFSPDERTLYVAQSDPNRPVIMAYDVQPDGTIANGRVFFDAAPLAAQGRRGLPDGLKLDRDGTLFATGPGGVLVIAPDGSHLGTILTGEPTANCAFGDDGRTLYMTANDKLMRIRTGTIGDGF